MEALARKRGIVDLFALTLQPAFFEAIGYTRTDSARYPREDPPGLRELRTPCVVAEAWFAKRLDVVALEAAA